MKSVVHIFGASGSGTSTLAHKICTTQQYAHVDTDDFFWMPTDPPFTVKRPVDERIRLMREAIERTDKIVISGSLTDWGDCLIPYFTLAVRIEMDPELRIQRLRQRERVRFGERILPGGDMYRMHEDFIAWARCYDTAGCEIRSRKKHDVWQKMLPCPLLYLDGADTVEENCRKVMAVIEEKAICPSV